ncbi:MAG TPA: hypothetical protein VFV94_20955, partial [Polyangiaceae bacterium]|nr:hypothetical protein [Polyangiaceae bacterium]
MSNDADDPIGARGDRAHHRRLLDAEHAGTVANLRKRLLGDDGDTHPVGGIGKRKRRSLVADQLV